MSKENIRPKKKSRRSIMRQIRSQQVKNKRMDSSSSSSSSSSVNIDDVDDLLNINLIIHIKSLISLMKQTLCSECNHLWDGSPSIKTRNGLYMHVEFICSNCGCITHLYSSP
jgi:RNase P subunit RPR2